MNQTRKLPITWRRTESARADSVHAKPLRAPLRPRCQWLSARTAFQLASCRGLGSVEADGVGDGHALDRLREEHVLRVDEVVAGVLGDLELVAERDRVEGAGELQYPQKMQRLMLIS